MPEDAFDALHMTASAQVDAFLADLEATKRMDKAEARRHADNAYLLVEFLANTYPKFPRDCTERDAWVFLFDYGVSKGPFAGNAVRATPRSLLLFFEWLARRERVAELEYIRKACAQEEYFLARLTRYNEIAEAARKHGPASVEGDIEEWWSELDERMRPRGLLPDRSLAGGEEEWGESMGPVEAAVFDATCVILARRARELDRERADDEARDLELLKAQRLFMTARNKGLGVSPLEAVVRERGQLAGQVPDGE